MLLRLQHYIYSHRDHTTVGSYQSCTGVLSISIRSKEKVTKGISQEKPCKCLCRFLENLNKGPGRHHRHHVPGLHRFDGCAGNDETDK